MRISEAQASALSARLAVPVRLAARLWQPYPKDVVAALVAEGVQGLVAIPLAPQSVDVYHASVREAVETHAGVSLRCAPAWGDEPAFVDACVETVVETLAGVPEAERAAIPVVLTAHSLPLRVIAAGDGYEREFRALAGRVAERLVAGGSSVVVAFQSQGMTGDEWLGPDLPATFGALAKKGARSVLVAPIGFVADHVETLYDLDVEAHLLAAKAGLTRLLRAPALNTRPRFIDALEAIARRELTALA